MLTQRVHNRVFFGDSFKIDFMVRNHSTIPIHIFHRNFSLFLNFYCLENFPGSYSMGISSVIQDVDPSSFKNIDFLFSRVFRQKLFWSIYLFDEFWSYFCLEFASPVTNHEQASFYHFERTFKLDIYVIKIRYLFEDHHWIFPRAQFTIQHPALLLLPHFLSTNFSFGKAHQVPAHIHYQFSKHWPNPYSISPFSDEYLIKRSLFHWQHRQR